MTETTQDKSDRELLEELGVDLTPETALARTPREERIIAGFEEIQRFVEDHGRRPAQGGDRDIFERIYATRLERIRSQQECSALVEAVDYQELLSEPGEVDEPLAEYRSDAELLEKLGVEAPQEGDITHLKHVRSQAEKKAAEEIANRKPCTDFALFKPLFDKIQQDLRLKHAEALLLKDSKDRDYMAKIEQGDWFIVNGQKAYIAELSKDRKFGFDKNDYRLRVIYDNRTESHLLLRSLQKALYEDETSRRITPLSAGPLFTDKVDEEDQASGIIYVLRSKSEHPVVAQHRDIIHKIGVTGGKVEQRIAGAKTDPTFLMADVEIVATYELFNINRVKLESLLHKFFAQTKLDIEIADKFGHPVSPQEWFLVPLNVIDEVVKRIKDGSIAGCVYDHERAQLVRKQD